MVVENEVLLAQAFNTKYLNLILFPTERCNFRCTYCYEKFKLGKMKPWVVNAVKSLIDARIEELEKLEISWFGGEPLIAKNIVFDISYHIANQANKRNPKLDFSSNITTNAYYLDKVMFDNLVDLGINVFQISLDGPREIHDLSRKKVNGKGTFDKIWKNLLEIKKSNKKAEIILRIHYDLNNFDFLPNLIFDLDRYFGSDERFKFYFKTINKLGSKNDSGFQTIPFNQKEIYEEILISNTQSKERLFKPSDPYVCYASKANSIGIRSDGSLIKCTVRLDHNNNQIGNINIDGSLTINESNFKKWIEGFIDFNPAVLSCPYSKMTGL